MAIKARNPFAPTWFTPGGQDEVAEDRRVQFNIRGLNGIEIAHVSPEMKFEKNGLISAISGSGSEYVLEHGLLGWKNLRDEANNEVKFSQARFDALPFAVISQLVFAILAASSPNEEQQKNS